MNKLSMRSKFLISLIPVIIASLIASAVIYKNGVSEDLKLKQAIDIQHIVDEQELAMVNMSEALRGYLLNPKDESEYSRKKENDEKYSTLTKQLSTLVGDIKEISDLNNEMAKLDATTLDEKENQVADLIKKDPQKAIDFYTNNYMSVRKTQNDNFIKLKNLVVKHSEEVIKQDNENKKSNAITTILILMSAVVFGFAYSFYVATKIKNETNDGLNYFRDIANELAVSATNLLSKSRSLSDSTASESAAIQETASSMHEINQMSAKTSENASVSRSLSEQSANNTQVGVSNIKTMIGSIQDISDHQKHISNVVENSNSKIAEIVTMINNIEAKTKVINEIVFQTKLLSFNASVEAARAGEHGKGFSVVAEEIGNLATLSGKASEEINQLLTSSVTNVNQIINKAQEDLVQTMRVSDSLINSGIDNANNCSHTLDLINKSVNDTFTVLDEISRAATEQSKGISEVNSAIEQFNSIVQENSHIAKEAHMISNEINIKSQNLKDKLFVLNNLINGES